MLDTLRAFGTDLSRWPPARAYAAREALLADPEFRIAWEAESELDTALVAIRETRDKAAAPPGAIDRIRLATLSQLPPNPLAGFGWRKVAAAMLVAGMLGGATDLVLPDPRATAPELVMLDPLSALEESELQ